VIGVAASTSLNKHSTYSNWGAEISVCAPSNNFHPLDPQQFVPGRGIWTTDNEAYGEGFTAHSRYTGQFGGTSSATPLVAGVAALVLAANPNLPAAEVKDILQSTADKIVDTDPDIILGVNRGQYKNGRCDWFGYGKINAAKAVAEAKRRLSP
jgi:subtilisin family serine protease